MKIADLRKHRENQEKIEAIDRMLERAIAHDVVIGSHSAPDFGKRFEKVSGYINGSGAAALDAKKRELERENRHIEDIISSVWRREVFQALWLYCVDEHYPSIKWDKVAEMVGYENEPDSLRRKCERYLDENVKE